MNNKKHSHIRDEEAMGFHRKKKNNTPNFMSNKAMTFEQKKKMEEILFRVVPPDCIWNELSNAEFEWKLTNTPVQYIMEAMFLYAQSCKAEAWEEGFIEGQRFSVNGGHKPVNPYTKDK